MTETNLTDTITAMTEPLAAALGLDVWGIDVAFGKRGIVRVYVESGDGVDLDKCAELSRLLGLSLDAEDVIPIAYVLEVSSPGLERTFFTPEQLARYTDKTVDVTLHEPLPAYPGRKKFLGTLVAAANGEFAVKLLDAPADAAPLAEFTWDAVKKAKLVHFLPEIPGQAKGRKVKQPKKAAAAETSAGTQNDEEI